MVCFRFPKFFLLALSLAIVMAPAHSQVIINEIKASSSDRILRWSDDGVSRLGVGTPWYSEDFDDSQWNTGQGPLGYGLAGLNTTVDNGGARSFYVRKTFTASAEAAASDADLRINLQFDDGVLVYLNGREVLRKSLGAPGLVIAYDHHAYNVHSYDAQESYVLGRTADLIHAGENTLAIQVHNVDIAHFQIPAASDSLGVAVDLAYGTAPSNLVLRTDTFRYFPGLGEPSGGEGDGLEFYDWVELYNSGGSSVSLDGWSLTDERKDERKWMFPDITMGAGEHLVVFASGGASPTLPLQASFRIPAEGGYLALVDASGVVADAFDPAYPPQELFHSYGRGAGGEWVYFEHPTAGAPNDFTSQREAYLEPPAFSVGSGLYDAPLELNLSAQAGATIWYNLTRPGDTAQRSTRFEFDRDGDREGWEAWNGTSNLAVAEGSLTFDMVGPDPHIGSPQFNLSASENPFINLRFMTTLPGMYQIFWSGSAGSWDEDRSIKFQVDTTGRYITKAVSLAQIDTWIGTIQQIRFDQPGAGGSCTIDFFRITSEPDTGPADPPDGLPDTVSLVPGREPDFDQGILYEGPIPIDSNTVVRARSVRDGFVSSPVETRSYLYDTGLPGDSTEALRSLPIISVVGDEERSLIAPHGFMTVRGGSYSGQHGWWVSGGIDDYNNPIMHGRNYEGPVGVSIFDPVTNAGVDLGAGMRIGRSDVARPSFRWVPGHWRDGGKWSFRLEFRNDYGQEWLEFPFQPEALSNNRFGAIALRTFGADPRNPFSSEELTRRIQIAMSGTGTYGAYANLFINGQYKCYINVCDRFTEEYFQNLYNSTNRWDVLKKQVNRHFQPVLELHGGNYDAWNELIAYVRSNDLANLANYREVASLVDLPQFIDWILTNVYVGNQDWPWNNWVAAREQIPEGKWRFYVWDADYTFQLIGNVNAATMNNMENQSNEVNDLYRALKRSPEFRLLFQDRVQKHCHGSGALTNGALMTMFNELKATLEPVIAHMYGEPFNMWIPENWFPARTDFLINHVASLGYAPALNAPTYQTVAEETHISNPNDQGDIMYTLNGTDPRVAEDANTQIFLPADSARRAWVPTEDLGDAWRADAPFDDAAWLSGFGAAGYESASGYENYIAIDVSDQMASQQASCYLRAPFTLEPGALDGAGALTLGLQYDDGCVVYLNGVEVYRALAPATLAWNANATGSHEAGAGFEEVDISQHLNLLRSGDNLLAIHGLNIGLGSSDFIVNGRLSFTPAGDASFSPGAQRYTGPISADITVPVLARVYDGSTGAWSPKLDIPPAKQETRYDWLKITEIMYHPAEGGAEFLELRNIGSAAINIGGVFFSDGITFTFPEDTILESDAYIVLVRSTTDFTAAYPGVPVGGVYVGSLDNAGETVTLRDPAGNLLVTVSYGDTLPWPSAADGQGFTLVIIDALSEADDSGNWRASGPLGGTPGGPDVPTDIPAVLVNEALTHTDPPQFDTIELFNPTDASANIQGWYITDDRMTPKKARIPFDARFVLSPGGFAVIDAQEFGVPQGDLPGFNLSSLGGEDVFIFSADANGDLTGYSHGFAIGAAANGISLGRHVTSEGKTDFVLQKVLTLGAENAGPLVGPVVISEIHYHPPEGATPTENGIEYIELTNTTDLAIPLWDDAPNGNPENTYELNGVGFRFPPNTVLPARGRLVVVGMDPGVFRDTHFVPGGTRVYGPFGNIAVDGIANLANDGERIALLWPDEPSLEGDVAWIVMDGVRYNDTAPWPDADGNGLALRRIDNRVYGNDPVNWSASAPRYTPGGRAHSADLDGDRAIDTSELLRVIQLYHTGTLACEESLSPTEDRYVAGAAAPRDCPSHASDFAPQDWSVGLRELLRTVQFYNTDGYQYCPESATEDTFCVGVGG